MISDQKPHEGENPLNIEGDSGESIFTKPILYCLTDDGKKFDQDVFQKELDEYWAHYTELKDERAVVVVGALCVEESLDRMIEAIFPKSKELAKNKDFGFSFKIGLIRAYKVIPGRILNDCDTIRKMRNDFAHELHIKTFDDWERYISENKKEVKRVSFEKGINHSLRNYDASYDLSSPYRLQFEQLVRFVTIALKIYISHAQAMRKYIDSEEFRKSFIGYSRRNFYETQR